MNELAQIIHEVHDGLPVVAIEGEIDASNAGWLATELRSRLSNSSLGLIVDLSGAAYLDSAGLNALAILHNELDARHQQLRLVAAPGTRAQRLLAITHLDGVLAVHAALADALAAVGAPDP